AVVDDGDAKAVSKRPPPASRLHGVRMFDAERWAAWGEGLNGGPGLFFTEDAGATWRAVEGAPPEVRVAAFADRFTGVAAGGTTALIRSGTVRETVFGPGTAAAWLGAVMTPQGAGRLVGDRGRMLTTDDFGGSWSRVEVNLPDDIAGAVVWRDVAVRDESIWVVGRPGGCVLHSDDGGDTWTLRSSGLTTPLEAVAAYDGRHVIAVGALGAIAVSDDGGETWTVTRGGARRAAYLAVHSRADRVEPVLLAAESALDGFRGAVHVAARDRRALHSEAEAADAAARAGVADFEVDTDRTLRRPGVERDGGRLVADWRAEAEGRGDPTDCTSLTAAIRAWRPDVLVVEGGRYDDALAAEVTALALRAASAAADGTRSVGLRKLGLRPWSVRRVVTLAPDGVPTAGRSGPRPWEPRDVAMITDLVGVAPGAVAPIGFETPFGPAAAGHGLFGGLGIAAGTASRRPFDPVGVATRVTSIDTLEKTVASGLGGPRVRSAALAAVGREAGRLPDAEAARLWYRLADGLFAAGDFDQAGVAVARLISTYPDTQEATAVIPRYLAALTSPELCWRRSRSAGDAGVLTRRPYERHVAAWDATVDRVLTIVLRDRPGLLGDPAVVAAVTASQKRRTAPSRVLAATVRALAAGQVDGSIVPVAAAGTPTASVVNAAGRLPASARVARCRLQEPTPTPDGEVTDPCWADAAPLVLLPDPVCVRELPAPTLCWLAGGRDALHWAGSVPDGPTRDDEVEIRLDLDGDGETFWRLTLHRDGTISAACGDDESWRPDVTVAVGEADGRWRFEASVPWAAFGPRPPRVGDRWRVSAGRRVAAVGTQSWADEGERPEVSRFARREGFAPLRFVAGGETR
ncbi:MAG: YCF48-related protein, partial [Planctomycetota bacterium]